jgi:hypothetical protein
MILPKIFNTVQTEHLVSVLPSMVSIAKNRFLTLLMLRNLTLFVSAVKIKRCREFAKNILKNIFNPFHSDCYYFSRHNISMHNYSEARVLHFLVQIILVIFNNLPFFFYSSAWVVTFLRFSVKLSVFCIVIHFSYYAWRKREGKNLRSAMCFCCSHTSPLPKTIDSVRALYLIRASREK